LFEVIDALNAIGSLFGPRQRRQEHAGENSDNGDDDQELNQGEGGAKAEVQSPKAKVQGRAENVKREPAATVFRRGKT
jgi:hypothetical protein